MRRYLLVLDRDLVTADEQSSPEPFAALNTAGKIGGYPAKSLPGHHVAAAEHRMNPVVQLEQVGCHAMGVITGQRRLNAAIRAEIRGHDYQEVMLATGRSSSWLARLLRLDPVHRLRMRLGHRLLARCRCRGAGAGALMLSPGPAAGLRPCGGCDGRPGGWHARC